jgi:hypothetical protein
MRFSLREKPKRENSNVLVNATHIVCHCEDPAAAGDEAIHLTFELDCHGRPATAGLPRNDKIKCVAFGLRSSDSPLN